MLSALPGAISQKNVLTAFFILPYESCIQTPLLTSVSTARSPSVLLLSHFQCKSIATHQISAQVNAKLIFPFWCRNGLVCLRNTALNFLHSWSQFLHQLLLDVIHLGPYSTNAAVKLELVLGFIPIQKALLCKLKIQSSFSWLLCFNGFHSAGGKIGNVTHVISNTAQLPWFSVFMKKP